MGEKPPGAEVIELFASKKEESVAEEKETGGDIRVINKEELPSKGWKRFGSDTDNIKAGEGVAIERLFSGPADVPHEDKENFLCYDPDRAKVTTLDVTNLDNEQYHKFADGMKAMGWIPIEWGYVDKNNIETSRVTFTWVMSQIENLL